MENIGNIGIASVAAITVICYLVGLIVKASGLNDKSALSAVLRPPASIRWRSS